MSTKVSADTCQIQPPIGQEYVAHAVGLGHSIPVTGPPHRPIVPADRITADPLARMEFSRAAPPRAPFPVIPSNHRRLSGIVCMQSRWYHGRPDPGARLAVERWEMMGAAAGVRVASRVGWPVRPGHPGSRSPVMTKSNEGNVRRSSKRRRPTRQCVSLNEVILKRTLTIIASRPAGVRNGASSRSCGADGAA